MKRKPSKTDEERARGRSDGIAEACRVLKWHLGHTLMADELWDVMHSGQKLREGPGEHWVTVPPLEMN